MKHTQYHRNYRNNYNTRINSQVVISALITILTFGKIPFSFLRNLETVGADPFSGLHRG